MTTYNIDSLFDGVSDIIDNFAQDFTDMAKEDRPIYRKNKQDLIDQVLFGSDDLQADYQAKFDFDEDFSY